MIVDKKLKTTLFGEEILLDFGIRFSGRIREAYPNYIDVAETGDVTKLMVISLICSLPKHFQHKTEDEILDEIDRINDPMLLHHCLQGFKDAMGFFAVALNGAVNAIVAVENAKPKKSPKQPASGTSKS